MLLPNVEISDSDSLRITLQRIKRTVSANKIAHYKAALWHSRWHYGLRIVSIVLTAVVGGSLFVTLETELGRSFKLLLAIASCAAAVFTVLQIFLRSGEHSGSHSSFATRFSSIERRIDILIADPPKKVSQLRNEVADIIKEVDLTAKYAPLVTVDDYEVIASPVR